MWHVHYVILDVQIDIARRIVEMRTLIVWMVLIVRRIAIGINQIGIVVVSDNIWFFRWAIFGDDLDMSLMIRPRVCHIHLLIGGGKVVVDSIAIDSLGVHIWNQVSIGFRDDIAEIVVAIGIVAVD